MASIQALFKRRTTRTRSKLARSNKSGLVRLSVFRSNRHIYAQLIDDKIGCTIAAVSTKCKLLSKELTVSCSTVAAAKIVGELIAVKGVKANVTRVVFDKGGRKYHGQIKALADAARENGLVF